MKAEIEWFHVADKEPEWNEPVLVSGAGRISIADMALGVFFDAVSKKQLLDVTHWAHLPQVPA